MTESYVLGFEEVDLTQITAVGGKARDWASFRGCQVFACRLDSALRRTHSGGSWWKRRPSRNDLIGSACW